MEFTYKGWKFGSVGEWLKFNFSFLDAALNKKLQPGETLNTNFERWFYWFGVPTFFIIAGLVLGFLFLFRKRRRLRRRR